MSGLPVTIFPGLGGRLAPENERIVERERSTDEGEKERDKIWERERDTVSPEFTVLAGFLCDPGHSFSADLGLLSDSEAWGVDLLNTQELFYSVVLVFIKQLLYRHHWRNRNELE